MLRCVGATFCWCLESFWRIIFTAPGNWNEMSAWFCSLHWHCSGLLCVWSALLWSVLFPFPQCKPIYALSRLADSLVRIHSSLILVSFACARAGRKGTVVWTVNGLAWVCFAPMTTLSTEQSQLTRHTAPQCSILSSCPVHSSQLTVPSSLNVKQHKVIDGWMHKLLMPFQTMRGLGQLLCRSVRKEGKRKRIRGCWFGRSVVRWIWFGGSTVSERER